MIDSDSQVGKVLTLVLVSVFIFMLNISCALWLVVELILVNRYSYQYNRF